MKNQQRSHPYPPTPRPPPLPLQGPPPAAAIAHVRGYLVGARKLKTEAPGSNVWGGGVSVGGGSEGTEGALSGGVLRPWLVL